MQLLKLSQSNRWWTLIIPLGIGILVNLGAISYVSAECDEWSHWATLDISCFTQSTNNVVNANVKENTKAIPNTAAIPENEENVQNENLQEISNAAQVETSPVAKVRCTKWYDWATLGVSCLIKTALGPSLLNQENTLENQEINQTKPVTQAENNQCSGWYDWVTLGTSCVITDKEENTSQLENPKLPENSEVCQNAPKTVEPDYEQIVKDTREEVINTIKSLDWTTIVHEAHKKVNQTNQAQNKQHQEQLPASQHLDNEQQAQNEQHLKTQAQKFNQIINQLNAQKQSLLSENQQLVLINQQLLLENELLHNTFNQKITTLEKKIDVLLQNNPWQQFSQNIKDVIKAGDVYEYALFRNGGFRKLTWSTWKSGYRVITEPYMTGDSKRHYRLGGSLWVWDNQLDPNNEQGIYHYYYFYDSGTVKVMEGNKLTQADQGGEGDIYRRKR